MGRLNRVGHLNKKSPRPQFTIKTDGITYSYYAYRLAFYYLFGRWPIGDIHHLCRNSICCNPDHLQEMSNLENIREEHAYRRSVKQQSS